MDGDDDARESILHWLAERSPMCEWTVSAACSAGPGSWSWKFAGLPRVWQRLGCCNGAGWTMRNGRDDGWWGEVTVTSVLAWRGNFQVA